MGVVSQRKILCGLHNKDGRSDLLFLGLCIPCATYGKRILLGFQTFILPGYKLDAVNESKCLGGLEFLNSLPLTEAVFDKLFCREE
ncbi:unnamed protein product [Schistosoma curassoni]|uniref:Uncharacterized protein n=1 Tax=Schistosoma curassoni TaxID=6186 RepID=A0A183KQC8_9TREM|nr:unnamed protein product [Schistosoma curassoni]